MRSPSSERLTARFPVSANNYCCAGESGKEVRHFRALPLSARISQEFEHVRVVHSPLVLRYRVLRIVDEDFTLLRVDHVKVELNHAGLEAIQRVLDLCCQSGNIAAEECGR